MRTLLLALLVVVATTQSNAQLNRTAYGIFGHYVYDTHTANFQSLPNLPCCSPVFTEGSGSGFDIGLHYQTPIARSWTFMARVGYITYGGALGTDEGTTVNVGGSAVPGNIHHEIVAKLASLSLEPFIGYRLTDRLTLQGGVLLGGVMTKSFEQTEALTKPTTGALTLPKSVGSGEIPNAASLHTALTLGLSYDIPIGHGSRWFMTPEVFYSFAFSNVVKDYSWKVNILRAGLAIKYSPSPVTLPDAPVGQKSRLIAAVKAFGMNTPTSEEEPIVRLKVEEFLGRTHKPLLPYIFFGAGSAEFPLQYHQVTTPETYNFQPEKYSDSTFLSVYYDMLNIIGKRMRERPASRLTLTGCNSNESSEKNNLALSQRRAETVRNYLVAVWKIDAQRIELKSRNLPANPSNINKEEGIIENRRVELAATDPEIMAPLITRDTTRVSTPPIVRFSSRVEAEAGVGSYSIAATQDNHLLQAFNGTNELPENVDWYLNSNLNTLPKTETPMSYTLRVTDRSGQEFTTPVETIPVEQLTIEKKRRERMGDMEIDRYAMMSFGFSQAELEPDNQRYLDQIQKDITSESVIHVVGSTDTMGDEDFNMNLSKQRARAVASAIKSRNMDVRGVGEQSMFDNSLPEGRFYNRTVRMTVETPVQR